jgi:hypothetical protein
MASPGIVQLMHEPSGTLRGKPIIREYWAKALAHKPDLHFELENALASANSVVLIYRGHRGLSAEVFWFNETRKVYRAAAHYAP